MHPCYERPRIWDIAAGEDGAQFPTVGHLFGISPDAAYGVALTADKRTGISLLRLDDPASREIPVAAAISDIDEHSGFVAMWSANEPHVLYYINNNPGDERGLFRYEQR